MYLLVMSVSNGTPRKLRVIFALSLLVSVIVLGSFAACAFESFSFTLEVKEPFAILDYPSGFSLFPGENVSFAVTVENRAPVTYYIELDFVLNDTDYQAKYVSFSSYNYTVAPGVQELPAWLMVSPEAPPAGLLVTVNRKTDTPSPSPSPPANTSFAPANTSFMPTHHLLCGGARWASPEGKTALYVNWKDNYAAHNSTDGANWEWISEKGREKWTTAVTVVLEQAGFEVTLAGDIPENLSDYDLVVLYAYYAAEPIHAPLIRDYVFNGGNVILLSGTIAYFADYSKTLSLTTDLTSIQEWAGCSLYSNAGGTVNPAFDNPLGTSFSTSDILFSNEIWWHAAASSLNEDSQPIAYWDSGTVFAYTYEYGDGRVYYQALVNQEFKVAE
jgi:hypothetical protein